MAAHETPDGVLFRSACWLVTARRTAQAPVSVPAPPDGLCA